jgi:hypothetical protein
MRPSTRVLQFRPASRSHGAPVAVDNELKGLEIDSATPLIGESGAVTLLDAFEGHRLLGGRCARRAANQCADLTTPSSRDVDATRIERRRQHGSIEIDHRP